MAQTNYTPIQIYHSVTAATVPSAANLLSGELGLNIANTDMSMYFENASGTVKLFFNNPAALKYPTTDGTANQIIKTDGAGVLSWTTAATGDVTLTGTQTLTNKTISADDNTLSGIAASSFVLSNASGNIDGTVAQKVIPSGVVVGTTDTQILTNKTISGADNTLTVDGTNAVGFRSIPQSGSAKTAAYPLVVGDVGKTIEVGSGGSVEIPNSTFAAGDAVLIFNNTSAGITITCTITTAYISGTDADKATLTLATRGIASILFISGTVCVVSGNVS